MSDPILLNVDEVALSADRCIKCNICNTACPVLPVTDLFPGPKYCGPQAQRFRSGDAIEEWVDYCSGCGACTRACPSGVKVAELVGRWWEEARRYQVLPLDNRPVAALMHPRRPMDLRSRYVFWPHGAPVPETVTVNVRNRPHVIAAEIDVEVRKIIEDSTREVRGVLLTRRAALEAIAQRLIEKEVIDGSELQQLLNQHTPGLRVVPSPDAEQTLTDVAPSDGSGCVTPETPR